MIEAPNDSKSAVRGCPSFVGLFGWLWSGAKKWQTEARAPSAYIHVGLRPDGCVRI